MCSVERRVFHHTFPDDADRPVIEQLIRTRDVITVVVFQDQDSTQKDSLTKANQGLDEVELRTYAERIRDEIRALPNITQISMGGIRPWEISINVPDTTLRQYGLTLDDIARVIRNASRDIPGGTIKAQSGDILVRALGQALSLIHI